MASSGSRWRTRLKASRTLSTRACCALPLVENDSIATRGVSPRSVCALRAEVTAISASSAGVGSAFTAQSAKMNDLRPLPEEIRHDHQEIARRQRDAVCQSDSHQPRFDHAPRRVGAARDHRVRMAFPHHHACRNRSVSDARRVAIDGVIELAEARERRTIALQSRIAARVGNLDPG